MTIPFKGKGLKANKSFQAQADVEINSPHQNNNQNVNVFVTDSNLTKDKAFQVLANRNIDYKELPVQERTVELESAEIGLNDNLEENYKERSIETAKQNLEEMEKIILDKNNLIEALSLILDIYERNPLIINKFIVAEENELTRLIFLLTGAEQIELIKSDPDTGCGCKVDKFTHIQKIMIKKNGNVFNFKYSFPNCVQLLETRHISYKIVM